MDVADALEGLDIRVVGMSAQRIDDEYHRADLTEGDPRGDQLPSREGIPVLDAERDQRILLPVVGEIS
jgi:hypothetical protein